MMEAQEKRSLKEILTSAEELKKREDEMWEMAFNRMRELQLRRNDTLHFRGYVYPAP